MRLYIRTIKKKTSKLILFKSSQRKNPQNHCLNSKFDVHNSFKLIKMFNNESELTPLGP